MDDFQFWEHNGAGNNATKSNRVEAYPEQVMLQLTSRCNLSCWHCVRSLTATRGCDAPKALIDYVVRRILPHSSYLRVGGDGIGEPLLAGHFTYFFSTMRKDNLKEVHLITNLTLLDEQKAELIAAQVDNIEISVEGTGEHYSRIRHFPWDRIVENIKMLDRSRRKNPASTLKITLLVCTIVHNLENLMTVFDLKEIGVDRVIFREFQPVVRKQDAASLSRDLVKTQWFIQHCEARARQTGIDIDIGFKDKYAKYGGGMITPGTPPALKDCFFPWTCISIRSSGALSSCCCLNDLAQLKNYEEDFLSVWNSKAFIRIRDRVNDARPWRDCARCEIKTGHLSDEEKARLLGKSNHLHWLKKSSPWIQFFTVLRNL